MKLVYVCSPFKADAEHFESEHVRMACRYCQRVIDGGAIPFAPHLLFPQFLNDNDPVQRALGIEMGIQMLRKCDELWCFGDRVSEGMKAEIQYAINAHIPIRVIDDGGNEKKENAL